MDSKDTGKTLFIFPQFGKHSDPSDSLWLFLWTNLLIV